MQQLTLGLVAAALLCLARASRAEVPAMPTAQACARGLLERIVAIRATPLHIFSVVRVREPSAVTRLADVGVGYRAIQFRRRWNPSRDSRVGQWIVAPVNTRFARETYTSLVELQDLLHELPADLIRAQWTNALAEALIARLTLPEAFARSVADAYRGRAPRRGLYATDLFRALAIRAHEAGRILIVYDENGRPA